MDMFFWVASRSSFLRIQVPKICVFMADAGVYCTWSCLCCMSLWSPPSSPCNKKNEKRPRTASAHGVQVSATEVVNTPARCNAIASMHTVCSIQATQSSALCGQKGRPGRIAFSVCLLFLRIRCLDSLCVCVSVCRHMYIEIYIYIYIRTSLHLSESSDESQGLLGGSSQPQEIGGLAVVCLCARVAALFFDALFPCIPRASNIP